MVALTLLFGRAIASNPLFLFLDLVFNILIVGDFSFRLRMVGIKRFFSIPSNIFDFVIVTGSVIAFILFVMTSTFKLELLEELSEEAFFIAWAVWQYLRLVLFLKKQREAQANAKTLVDFSKVMESEID